jgi:hypothetical protein
MPQFARPSADIANPGGWTTHTGGTTNLYATINEVTPDDTTYIQSPAGPANAVYVTKLSAVVAPGVTSGHWIRMRTSASLDNQQSITITQELRQGYVNESNQGTLIASQTRSGITSTTWTTSAYNLTAAEAGAITDYSNLYFRFIASAA